MLINYLRLNILPYSPAPLHRKLPTQLVVYQMSEMHAICPANPGHSKFLQRDQAKKAVTGLSLR